MLFIKDNIVKDSSLITLEINDKIVYNPSQELLEEHGWSLFSQDNIIQFSNKRFIETTSNVFDSVDKSEYEDTIVFLKDLKKIYLNGEYFGGEDLSVDYDEYDPSYNGHYVGEVNINGNSFEIGVPGVSYEEYEDSYRIGQLNVGDESFSICTPNNINDYESTVNNGINIGRLIYNDGFSKDIYIPENECEYIKNVTLEELNNLKDSKKLIPGQKYNITNFKTIIDENIGNVIYKDNEEHHILVEAIKNDTLNDDAKSISFVNSTVSGESSSLEPTDEIVVEDTSFKPYTCDVKVDLDTKKILDESQVVNAIAFKTKFDPDYPDCKNYVDYEGLYYYHGDQMNVDGQDYYVWDKYSNDTGDGFISVDYRKDNDYFWAQILTEKLYIDCSLKNPYVQDYVIHTGDTIKGYEIGYDKIVDIHYFNNVTNYIRFESNGWYVRCPELDQDDKFGWAFISNIVNTIDNSYYWTGGGNEYGPFPAFMNTYNLDDYFLTDTLDPQVGDSFYYCGNEDDDLDTIDKVWGTIIEPEISCKGIYHMKDEFENEAPYDFKHIKFNDLYTFGNEDEDYSLNGFENSVYNNKIMKPIDSQYNRINFSEKNVYGNTIYPSVVNCAIDFPIKESLITKSGLGLHVFDPTSFITPISVNGI